MTDLAAPGATSTENGYDLIDRLTSLSDAIRGIGGVAVDLSQSVFTTVRGVREAINPPNNSNVSYSDDTPQNAAQKYLPASVAGYFTSDNLLIGGGLVLGAVGLFIALKG